MTRIPAPSWIKGDVVAISDHGTIITVWVSRPAGHPAPIHFDRRMFAHVVEYEGDLHGQTVKYHFEEGTLEVIR